VKVTFTPISHQAPASKDEKRAQVVVGTYKSDGAGNETRTRDPDLGKIVPQIGQAIDIAGNSHPCAAVRNVQWIQHSGCSRDTLISELTAIALSLEGLAHEIPEQAKALQSHAAGIAKLADAAKTPRPLKPLPAGQARVLSFVRQYTAQHGVAPTRQEIADALGFTSANAAQDHLKRLDAKGVLTLTGSGPRAIRLNKRTTLIEGTP